MAREDAGGRSGNRPASAIQGARQTALVTCNGWKLPCIYKPGRTSDTAGIARAANTGFLQASVLVGGHGEGHVPPASRHGATQPDTGIEEVRERGDAGMRRDG